MKILPCIALIISLLISSTLCGGTSNVFNTREEFGEKNFGAYNVRNDVWGNNAGSQSLIANSGSDWSVVCNHGNSGGIKSYPHSGYFVNLPLSKVTSLTSNFATSVQAPAGPVAYSVTYDVWLQKHKYEIMIWMKWVGPVGPIGAKSDDNVNLGGHVFTVHKGSNGKNAVFSFLCKEQKEAGSVDLNAIMKWINTKGWFTEGFNTLVDEVQFGFEITSTPPNTKFKVSGFECKFNK
uniref:Cel 12A-1 n=1 Tax=Pachypsylla venusta TaxID=38123 RepID=A0A346D5T5_PACVE|nr:cel 12A-1 [Pachypsylla venusta]